MRHLALALLLSLPAQVAMAHQLTVFAHVDAGEVVVEAKFSSGRIPAEGEVRVFDAAETLLFTLPIGAEGETRFDLPDGAAEGGLMIEVEASDGHDNYWILTPDDIARGAGS